MQGLPGQKPLSTWSVEDVYRWTLQVRVNGCWGCWGGIHHGGTLRRIWRVPILKPYGMIFSFCWNLASPHPSGEMELPLLFKLLRPVWFLCVAIIAEGLTKISQIHLKSKGWTKISPLKTHSPGKLPDSQVMKFPLKLRGVNSGFAFPAFRWRVVLWMWQSG